MLDDDVMVEAALAAGGALMHWVTSDAELLERFARWAGEPPENFGVAEMCGGLALAHDLLNPDCPGKITQPEPNPPAPGHRRLRAILADACKPDADVEALRAEYDAAAGALFDDMRGPCLRLEKRKNARAG